MSSTHPQPIAGNRRILIVDDNPSIHGDFRKILGEELSGRSLSQAESELFGDAPAASADGKRGYELTSAHQGQAGLAAVEEALKQGRPFAMAFVDMRMPPGWDGIETIKRIWQVDPDVQVVICTAYSDYAWEDMIANLGASDRMVILKKPFDMVEVLQLANAFTEKWALLQQARAKLRDLESIVAGRTSELEDSNQKLRREIQERHLTEQALRAAQDKLNHFLSKSPAVLYSLRHEDGKFVPAWVTENFAAMIGANTEDWYRQTPTLEYVELADRAEALNRMETIQERGHVSVEYRIVHHSGRIRWVRDDRQLLRDDAGAPMEIVGCLTDITGQRVLEDQLRQSQKMESVGQLAGGVAHDFNNLLMVILGHVEMLIKDRPEDAPGGESLQRIQSAAERAGSLTRQLLAFSRKQVMRPRHLDLNELIEGMTKLLGRTLGEHIDIQTRCEAGLPAVLVDPAMIEQVVMNLAVNARDAMTQGGQLTVRTTFVDVDESFRLNQSDARPGRHVCLSVSDTGCGISPDHLPRIFEPFFTTKEVGKGTGLGLATVYGNVRQHNGWVQVDSQVGHGTTIKVYLPASNQAATPLKVLAPPTAVRGGKETILVVEDEKSLRLLINVALTRQGYTVHVAESGASALAEWADRLDEIQLMITDIIMPDGVSGWDLAKQFRALKPDLKVVYMSGYNTEMTTGKPDQDPQLCFLEKPFSPQRLTQVVREQLDQIASGEHQPALSVAESKAA